jgi:hypothetical protein
VATDSAAWPYGSISVLTASKRGSRSSPRITRYSTIIAAAPTYVHISERVAVASAKYTADVISKVGRPMTNSTHR